MQRSSHRQRIPPATEDRNPGRMPCTIQIDRPLAGMSTMSVRFT